MNKLFYGDNLTIMKNMGLYGVDLIYLDPPFNSQQNYNLLYKNMTGKPVPEQAEAFCDTWEMDAQKEAIAKSMPVLMRERGVPDYYVEFWRLWMMALRNTQPRLLAYLIYMVERLLYMQTLLSPTGSIYLHCDPAASHYIKVMMDGIFGHHNFQNEIIWKRSSSHNRAKRWGPIHDVILYYTKGPKYTWNRILQTYEEQYLDNFYRHEDDHGRHRLGDLTGPGIRTGDSGQPWRGIDPGGVGRHWEPPHDRSMPEWFSFPGNWASLLPRERLEIMNTQGMIFWPQKEGGKPQFKRYLDETKGVPLQDVITDIKPIGAHSEERLGYPTQKPVALLRRIIQASTKEGDVVFDPFCGCGTTIYAAHELNRTWIGCDIAILAIRLIRDILQSNRYRLVEGKNFEVKGIPVSVEQAQELFHQSPTSFQTWAVERAGGFPSLRKSADKGIDGGIYFEAGNGLKRMVLSVKGGAIRPTDIRDLRGVLEREQDAELAGFICQRTPTKAMQQEAASAGMYEYHGTSYPRIQLLTIADILEQKREFQTPQKMVSRVATGQTSMALSPA